MKNNLKIKQATLALTLMAIFSMPITVSAQSFWDVFTSEYWYSLVADGSADPNDDKKKKPDQPPPKEPLPQPAPEQCFEGVIPVPCPIDNK